MTPAEIERYIDSRNRVKEQEMKERAIFDYNLANLIGISVSRIYSKSNKFPSIEEAYPTLFKKEEIEQVKEDKITEQSVANFMAFADNFNSRFREVAKNDE